MPTLRTIIDDDGRVWQGAEVDESSVTDGLAECVLTGGISELVRMIAPDDESVTVEINGAKHSGTPQD